MDDEQREVVRGLRLYDVIAESHNTAVEKGWWQDGDRPILEQLMLMVTELAEAAEQIRDGRTVGTIWWNTERPVKNSAGKNLLKPEGFLAELADVLIRMSDTVGKYGLADEFLEVLVRKLEYNRYREHRHGGKTA